MYKESKDRASLNGSSQDSQPKRIPRTLLQTPHLSYFMEKKANLEGASTENNKISLSSTGRYHPIPRDFCHVLNVHNWKYSKPLEIECNKYSSEGLQKLTQRLKNPMLNPKTFALKLTDSNQIDNKKFESLIAQITRHFDKLQHLSLNFVWCDLTDASLKLLSAELTKKPYNLQSLNISFERCSKITRQGITQFAKSLRRFGSLKALSLNFSCRFAVGAREMNIITSNIVKYLVNLKHLNLQFQDCAHVTDEGLKALGSNFTKLSSNVKGLNLDFRQCLRISIEAVKLLANELTKKSDSLRKLNLDIAGTTAAFQNRYDMPKIQSLLSSIPSATLTYVSP